MGKTKIWADRVLTGIAALILAASAIVTWHHYRQNKKRQNALWKAAAKLPENERLEWANRQGRYSNPAAIPRNFPLELMNASERYRYFNREGEFSRSEGST